MTYLEEVSGRSITVRNIEYTIEVLSEEEIDEIEGCEVFGIACGKESKIYLREGMNDRRAQQTLIHEVLHAMFFESGYTFEDEEQEEAIVTSLSLVMHDMVNTGGLTFSLDEEVSFIQMVSHNTNFEDIDESNKSENLNMFLVTTLWDTYTVNTYGKNRIELANKEGERYIKVYDFQTKKQVSISLRGITHIEELPKEEK